MKLFGKAVVTLLIASLVPVIAVQPAAACAEECFNGGLKVRVSNRAWDDRTACVHFDHPDDPKNSTCKNIKERDKFTWLTGFHVPRTGRIKVRVEGGGRGFDHYFEVGAPTRDICYRYSSSGSFHEAKDCVI